MKIKFIKICAWCERKLDEYEMECPKLSMRVPIITHGICSKCKERILREDKKLIDEEGETGLIK